MTKLFPLVLIGIFLGFSQNSGIAQAPPLTFPQILISSDSSTNNPDYWNAPYWWDAPNESTDKGETPTDITVLALHSSCVQEGLSFRYILKLDLNNDNIQETKIDSDSLPPANLVYYGNNSASAQGVAREFDTRAVPLNEKWGFSLNITSSTSQSQTAHISWTNTLGNTVVPQLPHGIHSVTWIVKDACGQTSECQYIISIADGKAPEVVTKTFHLANTQFGFNPIFINWDDVIETISDNHTLTSKIELGLRRKGAGTGFPVNSMGNPASFISEYCSPEFSFGIHTIEVWARDKAGNTAYNEATFIYTDNTGGDMCAFYWGEPPMELTGRVVAPINLGIKGVKVDLTGNQPTLTAQTDSAGYYHITTSIYNNLGDTLRPVLNIDPLNGVDTWDLVLISRHILGLVPLNTPYKLIAADVNQSGTITTFDIVTLRKLILGSITQFPDNTSWRFIPLNTTFTNAANPFAQSLPGHSMLVNHQYNFMGIKIGDVDHTASVDFSAPIEDRTMSHFNLEITDRKVETGEVVEVRFKATQKMAGYQFTLHTDGLDIAEVLQTDELTSDNFEILRNELGNSLLTMVVDNGVEYFDIQFMARRTGQLSEMLHCSSEITRALAFDEEGIALKTTFLFTQKPVAEAILLQNTPNPWQNSTAIGFYLPEASIATVRVSDSTGRLVFVCQETYQQGYNQIPLTKQQLKGSGLFFYQLDTKDTTITRKMIVEE